MNLFPLVRRLSPLLLGIVATVARGVDQGSPDELIARYGRADMEEVFLDIARGGDEQPAAGAAAENIAM